MKNHSLPIICLMIMVFALPLNIYSQSVNHSGDVLSSRLQQPIDDFKDKHLIKKESPAKTISNETLLGNGFLLTQHFEETWYGSSWMPHKTWFNTYNTDNLLVEKYYVEPVYIGSKSEYTYDNNNRLIQELLYIWNPFTNNWEIGDRTTYTYNNQNKPVEILYEHFDLTIWYPVYRLIYNYNGNEVEEIYQTWYPSGWEIGGRYLYTYDANNNLIQLIIQDWQNGNWINVTKDTHTYDANNLLLEDLYQQWDGANWNNIHRALYTNNGLLNITVVDELWTGQWTFDRQTTKTYNTNNLLMEEFIQTWDGYQGRNLYYYDMNNNLIERTEETGYGGVFEFWIRDRYNYSSDNFLAGNNTNLNLVIPLNQPVSNTITISGGGGYNPLQNATIDKVTVLIDELLHPNVAELNLTLEHSGVSVTILGSSIASGINFIDTKLQDDAERTLQQGNAPYTGSFQPHNPLSVFSGLEATGDWTLTATDVATGNEGILESWGLNIYLTSSSDVNYIDNTATDYKMSQNYPNPFNPSTTIKFQIPETGFISLKIYDILGNEITTLVNEELQSGSYEATFNAAGLSSGIYFYKLSVVPIARRDLVLKDGQADAFIETKKMILIK